MTWRHVVCDDCWDRENPGLPSPRTGHGEPERCCRCGEPTRSGIYVRFDPAECRLGGDHG